MPKLNAPRARTSRSCENCRGVKRRCDKQIFQCGQCIRAHETCLGYRDEWELIFRDQTNHTIIRSSKTPWKNGGSTEAWTPPTPRSLNPSLEEIGVNYFFQEFVAGGRCPSRGYLNYIPTVYSADAENLTLVTSMTAVGLMALATHKPELTVHALARYSEAICLVNNALASPVEAVKDSILMSVISLGVFEHVSNFESWIRHVKGAAALVVARGKSQFTRRSSILMFNQVRADMTAACIQCIQPFPDDLRELQEEATKYTDRSNDAFWLLGVLATRCATLYADVTKKNIGTALLTPMSWFDFLSEAIALQSDFQHALSILTMQEPYMTIRESNESATCRSYRGYYDLYKSFWSIRLWNNSRMIEIIVCEIICWLINKTLTEDPTSPVESRSNLESKLQYTMKIMSRRGEEIVASIPQALGLVSAERAHIPQQPNVSGGYMLIWNLYTVGKCPTITHQDRQWVIRQLKGISESGNIAMASQLAEDLIRTERSIG